MRSNPPGEADSMEPEQPTESAPKARRVTSKTPTKPPTKAATTRRRPVRSKTEPVPTPPPVSSRLALNSARLLGVVAAAAAAVFLLVGTDDQSEQIRPGVATLVSTSALAELAAARETQVYWAGNIESRELELTTTRDGTFLRYLVAGTSTGTAKPALTVATYPMAAAYATANRRAKSKGMTSRPITDGGIAVWSLEQPTSVYVASRGVPSLVEVYSPSPAEARTLALSGRIRPVR
jgi:uncharacterized secreted protein with C-terminal beta-propeller domain